MAIGKHTRARGISTVKALDIAHQAVRAKISAGNMTEADRQDHWAVAQDLMHKHADELSNEKDQAALATSTAGRTSAAPADPALHPTLDEEDDSGDGGGDAPPPQGPGGGPGGPGSGQ